MSETKSTTPVGCYLEENFYYVTGIKENVAMVSLDGADEVVPFAIEKDEEGMFFVHEGDRIPLKFAGGLFFPIT